MKLTRSSRVVVASSPLAKLVLEGTGSLEDLDGSLGPLEEPLSLDELEGFDEPPLQATSKPTPLLLLDKPFISVRLELDELEEFDKLDELEELDELDEPEEHRRTLDEPL
jgi:hypothetical protein